VSVGEPAEGSLKKEKRPVFFIRMGSIPLNRVYIPLLLWQAALGRRLRLIVLARGPKLLCLVMSEYYIIFKTFNNGSLGSGIDEERSEMR
jgi:hypothetical protein